MNDNNDNIWNMPELTVNEIDEFLANPMPIMEPLFLPETQMSVNELSSKIEQLTLDSSTQALRIKIERAKRQKLKMSIRALKQQLSLPCPDIVTTRQEIENMQLNHATKRPLRNNAIIAGVIQNPSTVSHCIPNFLCINFMSF